jgi:hypothetical protein
MAEMDEFPTNQDIEISYPDALKFKADADAAPTSSMRSSQTVEAGVSPAEPRWRLARRPTIRGRQPHRCGRHGRLYNAIATRWKLVSRGPSRTGERLDA